MFRQWQIVGALAVFLTACGGDDDPLVCPAGTVPVGDECVEQPDAGQSGADAAGGMPDAGCVPTGEVDAPDPSFADTDCDGIDGDAAASIFVAPDGDDAAAGTAGDPLQTLGAALARAQTESKLAVLVSAGTYDETASIELLDGISVYGGYDRAAGWTRSRDGRATVRGPSPVILGDGVTAPTTVALLRIEAPAAEAGQSSIAARLVDSTAVTFDDIELVAGRGADGAAGSIPAAQLAAANGNGGEAGMVGCPVPDGAGGAGADSPGCTCAAGGVGGDGDVGFGAFGSAAEAPAGGPCAIGAAGGDNGGGPGAAGKRGDDGLDAATGGSGAGGIEGSFTAAGYEPTSGGAGEPGVSAGGGGGGGGGGGQAVIGGCAGPDEIRGGGGGGGGAGGCGGAGASGGGAGGASIALYLWNATPTLSRVVLTSARGGTGGAGATGGPGGDGGAGGAGGVSAGYCLCGGSYPACIFCISGPSSVGSGRGGDGGAGGGGGTGGASGGGAGGPSIGIVLGAGAELSAASDNIVFELGTGGAGGAGGDGGNAGTDGTASQTRVIGP